MDAFMTAAAEPGFVGLVTAFALSVITAFLGWKIPITRVLAIAVSVAVAFGARHSGISPRCSSGESSWWALGRFP